MRNELLELRRALSQEESIERSQRAVTRFLNSSQELGLSWKGLHVALYRGLSDELNLQSLEKVLEAEGAFLYFPRVVNRESAKLEMIHVSDSSETTGWKNGAYGISEPSERLPNADALSLDLILVPGVGFGMKGERIGMGAGYYDRYLARAPQALRVALAFDFQLQARLEQKEWDQPVHWIVTDQQEVRTNALEKWLNE